MKFSPDITGVGTPARHLRVIAEPAIVQGIAPKVQVEAPFPG
jgi:hypothetical protein